VNVHGDSLPRGAAEVQPLGALTLRDPACYTRAALDDAILPRPASTDSDGICPMLRAGMQPADDHVKRQVGNECITRRRAAVQAATK